MSAPTAARDADLLHSMGVVTHINYTDGGYADINADLTALRYLGIDHVRDESPNPSYDQLGQTHLGDAANAGVCIFCSGWRGPFHRGATSARLCGRASGINYRHRRSERSQ